MRSGWKIVFGSVLLWGSAAVLAASQGSKTYNELLESGGIYDDADWQAYVTEVGERVLAVTPHKGRNYTFVLLDDTMVNAFTTGDGYVFLTRGLMAYFTSEDELASVIGHEIGHVVGQHIASKKRRHVMTQVLGWLGVIGTNSMSMLDLANTLSAAASADYGRKEELEADAFSAEWLAKAGYDPQSASSAIQQLRDHELYQRNVVGQPSQYHGIFRSHPEHQKRIHEFSKLTNQPGLVEVRAPERDFMAMLDGMVFGEDAASGVVKDSTYYHSSHRVVVTFPNTWEVGNSRTEVMGKAPAAQDAYVTMQRQQAPGKDQTPEDYVKNTLKRDDVENGESIMIGQYPAFIGEVKVAGKGTTQKRLLAVVFKDDSAYLFKGEVGQNGDVKKFDEAFVAIVTSFRAMTATDLRTANTRRLEVVEARPGDTFAKLAQGAPIPKHGEEMLRVINGKHPYGEPRAGDMVKVIR